MNAETRQTVYMGISFVFSPMPIMNKQTFVSFQGALLNAGIDFTQSTFPSDHELVITRDGTSPFNIRVVAMPPAVGQIVVVAPQSGSSLDMFIKETEAVIAAFDESWPSPRQVLHSDATFRDLFEASGIHAFQELWEKRLKQPTQSLNALGRPVLGGGLRLVMPPQSEDPYPTQIEVKIESYLQDSRKFFIETQFTWPQPIAPGVAMNPQTRLKQLDDYIERNVIRFTTGDL